IRNQPSTGEIFGAATNFRCFSNLRPSAPRHVAGVVEQPVNRWRGEKAKRARNCTEQAARPIVTRDRRTESSDARRHCKLQRTRAPSIDVFNATENVRSSAEAAFRTGP